MSQRLQVKLSVGPALGGINLRGTLQAHEPLTIDCTGALQTTKEHWRPDNCRSSFEERGIYEAPGSLFWLSVKPAQWGGETLPAVGVSYAQVAAGRQMWSIENFNRLTLATKRSDGIWSPGQCPSRWQAWRMCKGGARVSSISLASDPVPLWPGGAQ